MYYEYIRYNNIVYDFLDEKEYYKLITRKKEKIDESFYKKINRDVYIKKISIEDPSIQDIYDVIFYINWDSKIDLVTKEWKIRPENYAKSSSEIYLTHEGKLDGWHFVEWGVCSNVVSIDEIEAFYIEYKYIVKDGEKLTEPITNKNKISKEEFIELISKYQRESI